MADIIDQKNNRENGLYRKLLASPLVEVAGIVSANGVCGSKPRGQELWSLHVVFDAWRIKGEKMHSEPLMIRRRVTQEELREFQSLVESETVISIQARISEENMFGSPQAYFEKYIGLGEGDMELQKKLEGLQKPKTFESNQFGIFTFDHSIDWYATSIKWTDIKIDLMLHAQAQGEIDTCLEVAQKLWSNQTNWKNRVDDYAVDKLLLLKNEAWLDENENDFSSEMFKNKMRLVSISIYPDGDF